MKPKIDTSTIDNLANEILKEENPTAEAVNALIKVSPRKIGEVSDVELKTDLTADEIKVHTVLDLLSNVLEMKKEDFNTKCILADLVHRKERKALSKDRQSRAEIVAVAKQPDMNMGMDSGLQKESFVRRFFTSRKNRGGGL